MTNNDDPFGRRDRTIIRPNPGGRRPPPPGAPGAIAPPTGGGAPPASTPTPPVAYPPPNPTPGSPQAAPPNAGQAGWDGWMNAPAQNLYVAANTPTPMTPAPISPHVSVDLVTVASSPLMRASASLLLLLGRLRASLARAGAGQLMDQVAQAIQQFEIDARAAGAPSDQIETAKYALAACADDIVQNLPSEDSRIWTQYSMLVRFFNERMGGLRFFKELDRAKQNPAVNLGLLEVMHACLSLGFEGVYRASGGPGRAANHPSRSLRDDPAGPAQDNRRPVAALARPEHRADRQPVSCPCLGGRGMRRGDSVRLLRLSPQRAQRKGRSARD